MGKKKYNTAILRAERKRWTDIPTDKMDEKTKKAYETRKKAVDMYIDGYKKREIKEETGSAGINVLYLIERCLKTGPDGEPYGYAGLIPNINTAGYTKKRGSRARGGSFQQLLDTYPQIKELIIGCCRNDPEYSVNKNMQVIEIHELMMKKCTELGIQDSQYPFNTDTKALKSLERYVNEIRYTDPASGSASMDKDARQKSRSAGYLEKCRPAPCMPYSIIHVDGHKLDILYVVRVDDGDGMFHYDIAMRPWVFTVLDLKTDAVLGYYLTQNEEYNSTDVMKALQHAALPKKQYPLDEGSALHYPPNGGWPDTAFPVLEYSLWDCIMMDNALSHQAVDVTGKLTEELGVMVSFGPVSSPTVRPNVERSFGTIEHQALHRLPYTVGSSPQDERYNEDAAKAAVRDMFTFEKLQAFVDVMYCTYNNSPNKHNRNGASPIDEIRRLCINSGMVPVTADDAMIRKIKQLHYKTAVCSVRGSLKTGRRPYFQWNWIEYKSPEIARDYSMLERNGKKPKKVLIEYDPDNIRTVRVFDAVTLFYIGEAHATGKWNFDHTERQHLEMVRMENKNNSVGNKFSMPAAEYVKELREKAKKERRSRTKADIAAKTMMFSDTEQDYEYMDKEKENKNEISGPRKKDTEMLKEEVTKDDILITAQMAEDMASGMSMSDIYNKYFGR